MLTTWASLPGILINIVFACLFLGFTIPSLRTIWREGGPQLCYGWTVGMGQYMAGVDISVVLLSPLSATAQCMTRARGPLCQGVGSALVSATHMQCPSAPRAAAVWEDPQ